MFIKHLFGNKCYYKDESYSVLHREDGPAIEYFDGSTAWFFNGDYHRIGGPSYETPFGHKEWCKHGKYHREDGPAIIDSDGDKEWFLDGLRYSEEDYYRIVKLLFLI